MEAANSDVAQHSHQNLLQFYRKSPAWSRNGKVREENGALMFATDSRYPLMMNGMLRTQARSPADGLIATAENFFGPLGRGYSVWVQSPEDDELTAAAAAAGLHEALQMPAMWRPAPVKAPVLGPAIRIAKAEGPDEVRAFVEISAVSYTAYQMQPDTVRKAFSLPERILAPNVSVWIAYVKGRAAAAAMSYVSEDIAGVYWVGTRIEFRGRGLGEAVTAAATNAGFDLGARGCTLQASPMGASIYLRMGY